MNLEQYIANLIASLDLKNENKKHLLDPFFQIPSGGGEN